MQKTPAARYASCAEVIEALRPFAAGRRRRADPTDNDNPASESIASDGHRGRRRGAADGAPDRPAAAARPVGGRPETATRRPASADARAADGPAPAPAPRLVQEPAPQPEAPEPAAAPKSLGQRLGALGFVLLALLAGAVAWLVCNLVLPK